MASGGSLRQIRRRIRSVENTKKITHAMEMVAASKLRRYQDLLESSRPYTEKLGNLLQRFVGAIHAVPTPRNESPLPYQHPYLETEGAEKPERKTAVVLFTSDAGLCGTYNGDLETKARRWLRENPDAKKYLVFVGKHGAGQLHRPEDDVLGTFFDLRASRIEEVLRELRRLLEDAYRDGRINEVVVIYPQMESITRFLPAAERILPMPQKVTEEKPELPLIEPDLPAVLNRLIPAFFDSKLRLVFFNALLAEQMARMSAMRQATKNAKDMIDALTLQRNKARQAAITKEIIEVVSGSRALKVK